MRSRAASLAVLFLLSNCVLCAQTKAEGNASHEHLVATCAEVPPGEKCPEFGCFMKAAALAEPDREVDPVREERLS